MELKITGNWYWDYLYVNSSGNNKIDLRVLAKESDTGVDERTRGITNKWQAKIRINSKQWLGVDLVRLRKWVTHLEFLLNEWKQEARICSITCVLCSILQKLCTVQSVNCRDIEGRQSTPLHFAAGYNRVSVVEYLLQHGADVHAKDKGQVPTIAMACLYLTFLGKPENIFMIGDGSSFIVREVSFLILVYI